MSRKRYKEMKREEFIAIAKYGWQPASIIGDALPNWMSGIPKERFAADFAEDTRQQI